MLNLSGITFSVKKSRPKHPTFKKEDKIREYIQEWNTIDDVELYKPLYDICAQLFLETENRKLECLNYYIDHERDSEKGEEYTVMYAEIKNTGDLPLKERYEKHKELLKRVMSNDTTLIYCISPNIQTDDGQLSLFG